MQKMKTALFLVLALCASLFGETDHEVVVFLGTECPMARLYANRLNEMSERYPSVKFRAVNASEQDSEAEVAEFGKLLRFPVSKDDALAHKLGATRSPEAFLLQHGRVVYSGRIDDQYTPGSNMSKPTRHDLEEALKESLEGKRVSVPHTEATGCRLSIPEAAAGEITYQDVAPIFHKRCAECHRPGQVAPFSLLTYQDTVGWGQTIREVITQGRMPPWHADPRHGKFANDRSLTSEERDTLLAWIDAGSPRGDAEPSPPTFHEGWSIRADKVLTTPDYNVPAEGVLDYVEFPLDTGFTQDTWVQGVELRAGNKRVVHHINVYLRPKGAKKGSLYLNSMSDFYLAMMVPGNAVTEWPSGIAKVIPAGWQIVLSIHYQPNGAPQTDRSSIALQLADASAVKQQAATRLVLHEGAPLPSNEITTITKTWTLEDDFTLYALYPHMHLRGKSMRLEADGEILLDVPRYDFNWQTRYVLAEPLRLKKGTLVRCTAVYDNTSANPNNPDPNVAVEWGTQSTDEMFQAGFEVVRTHEDRLAQSRGQYVLIVGIGIGAAFLLRKRLGSVLSGPNRTGRVRSA